MADTKYNIQLEKLCDVLHLGEIIGMPEAISGGLLHKMYAVETTRGKYAIKALNPQIMARPAVMQNYTNSEQIASVAANSIPALPAKVFNGTAVQEIDNQFYLVFDWVDGKSLKANEISVEHCQKIGCILSNIHMTDFSLLNIDNDFEPEEQLVDWNYYLKKGQDAGAVWAGLLLENIGNIYEWNALSNKSAKQIASNMVISHRDLDSKNVMWHQNTPIIIDWEAAGYVNPLQELTETAIYWSENESGSIDKNKFSSFVAEYRKKSGKLHADWRVVLENGFTGKLGWLEYNLKRSLWIECADADEQRLGTTQVTGTIEIIRRYAETIPELEKLLSNELP